MHLIPSRTLLLALFYAVIFAAVLSTGLDRASARIIAGSGVRQCEDLFSVGRIVEVAPKVFAPERSENRSEELASLTKFVNAAGGTAFLIGNFKDIRGVPSIDAVYQPTEKRFGPINLSIKTSFSRERTNGMSFIRKSLETALSSISKWYRYSMFAELLGLEVVNGVAVGKGSARVQREDIFGELTAIIGMTPTKTRAVGILIDLSREETQRPYIVRVEEDDMTSATRDYTRVGDHLLQVFDRRLEDVMNEQGRLLNLTSLVREIQRRHSPVAAYYILFHTRLLSITSRGFTVTEHAPFSDTPQLRE